MITIRTAWGEALTSPQPNPPTQNPCLEINIPQAPKMRYVIYGHGNGGGPKCECGKDKHGFAFHMRFCPKWEPTC